MKPASIAAKITWLNVAVSSAALFIAALALLIYDQQSYKQSLLENVAAQSDVVGRNSVSALEFGDPFSAEQTLSALDRVPYVLGASLFRPDGTLFASYQRDPKHRVERLPVRAGVVAVEEFRDRELVTTRSVRDGNRVIGYVVMRADTTQLGERLRRYLAIIGVVFLLALLAALVLSAALRRTIVQPIAELAQVAKRVSAERDYSVRVRGPRTGDEVSVLVDSFNEMLFGIEGRDIALEEERARLRTILDTAPVGIMVVDSKNGEVVLANRAMNDILQEPVSTLGKFYGDWKVLRPDGETLTKEERPLTRALDGATTKAEEFIVERRDKSRIWVRAIAAPVRERGGEITGALLVVAQIDEQKKAQEALLLSERLAAAGRLAASVSHEINNPLASVTNLIYLALNDPGAGPDVKELLQMADRELKRVSHIATQTLQFYRQSSSPAAVDMGELVDSIINMLSSKIRNTDIRIHKEYRAKEQVICFEGEMRQVFTNLITNAIDATPRLNGRLRVRTKAIRRAESPGVQITIADNGHGMPPDTAARIFDPFYTTKGMRGTGLGLWVSKEIVSKHSGTIRVRSRQGRGAVFVVFLPFDGASRKPETQQSQTA